MRKLLFFILISVLLSSAATAKNRAQDTPQPKFKVINNSNKFVKVLDFTPIDLTKVDEGNKKEVDQLKASYVRAYLRALKFTKEAPDGILTLTANKDTLKVTQALFNMVKYVIDDQNVLVEKLKKEKGVGNYSVSPISSVKIKSLDNVSIEELNALYYKANK